MNLLTELLVKSTAFLATAAVVVALMRRSSASSRHLIWTGVFCAIVMLPVARLALPAWRLALLAPQVVDVDARRVGVANVGDTNSASDNDVLNIGAAPPAGPRQVAAERIAVDQALVALWLLGVIALVGRRAGGWMAARRVLARATSVTDERVLARLQGIQIHFGVRRPISLVATSNDRLPCTLGIRRPAILLPESFLASSSASRLDAVLTHEAAHVARLDWLAEQMSVLATALFWFNPLMWLAAGAARVERERAADDAVLAAGARASDYASDLVAIARSHAAASWSGALSMAASGLERRVRAILDEGQCRTGRSRVSILAAWLLIAIMMPFSAAQLVARSPVVREIQEEPIAARVAPAPLAAEVVVQKPVTKAPPTKLAQQISSAAPPQKQGEPVPAASNLDRTAMLKQVYDLARKAYEGALRAVEIGTAAAIDVLPLDMALARIEEAIMRSSSTQAPPATASEVAAVRLRFAAALAKLQETQVRYDNGMVTSKAMADALLAAAAVWDPAAPTQVPTPALSDAALLESLKATTSIASESARADALLDLARRYAFTPAMVTAYVAAANSIKNDAERARVFAQSIRVKSPGGEWYFQRPR